jgi:hypothetical protein
MIGPGGLLLVIPTYFAVLFSTNFMGEVAKMLITKLGCEKYFGRFTYPLPLVGMLSVSDIIKIFLTFKFRYLFIFQPQCSSIERKKKKPKLGLQIGGKLILLCFDCA